MATLRRGMAIHERLTRVEAAGEGAAGIAEALHDLTGLAVAVEDRYGNLSAWAGPGQPDPYPKPSAYEREQLLRRLMTAGRSVRDGDRVVALASPRPGVLGLLALIDPHRRAGTTDVMAIEHGATVLAVELARLRGLADTELRVRRELVQDLLTGTDDESAYLRAEALDYDLGPPHQVAVMEVTEGSPADEDVLLAAPPRAAPAAGARPAGHDRRHDGDRRPRRRRRLGGAAPGHRRAARRRWLPAGRRGAVSAAVRCCPGPCAKPSWRCACRRRHPRPSGRRCSPTWTCSGCWPPWTTSPTWKVIVSKWLGALAAYDERKHTELVRTLTQYLQHGGGYEATSRALSVHRSTLKYRLQRIRELTGFDLGDPETHFNLQLATRAWVTLQALRG